MPINNISSKTMISNIHYAKRRGGEDRQLHGIGHDNQHPRTSRPTGAGPVQGDAVRKGGIKDIQRPLVLGELSPKTNGYKTRSSNDTDIIFQFLYKH